MKLKVIEEESRNEPSTMSKLENAIYEACNMAFMLAAAVEGCNDADEKREAITFGCINFMTWYGKPKKYTENCTRKLARST